MHDHTLWQAKLAAYIHDPASKALILMRGLAHEKGSVAELRRAIFQDAKACDTLHQLDPVVKRADRWASAADRPSLPRSIGGRVVFAREPALIHPLSASYFALANLEDREDAAPAAIEKVNFDHFKEFIVKEGNEIDWRRTFLAFWRFGRIPPAPELGLLWQELPADTRSPDHSIWEHVALTSAFAGALHAGGEAGAALLLVSFGPVQGFIAQARSVSDLWAGSHLLSTIAWQGMRVVCERFGPDAVLFPNLIGVPLVDVWMRQEMGLDATWPENAPYPSGGSDANPLFCAALPNRFLALVPADGAEDLARKVETRVRQWILARMDEVLDEIGLADDPVATNQIRRQLAGFPEVNWSLVPWRLAGRGDGALDDAPLKDALARMGHDGRYLDEAMEKIARRDIDLEGERFFQPNPGVAYPGLFELAERLHAAAKGARPFSGTTEVGYRCSLCGEREWLSNNRDELNLPPGRRHDTVWLRLYERLRIIKKGEHLCAMCALKRFWPRIFTRWVEDYASVEETPVNRYVISTHTMALATSIWNHINGWNLPKQKDEEAKGKRNKARGELEEQVQGRDTAALPFKLFRTLADHPDADLLRRLPALLDRLGEQEDEQEEESQDPRPKNERARIENAIQTLLGNKPEAYYGILLMDGDRMGQWLAAGGDKIPTLAERFHQNVREELGNREALREYLKARRVSSPSWHQAVSTALNGFAVELARVLVEEVFMGKLIYAGGDDLLAMVAVHDLPGLMLALRCAYSGHMPLAWNSADRTWRWLTGNTMPGWITLRMESGYCLLERMGKKKLLRLMGPEATASMGAVVAHHKTPLVRVLAALRTAERRAKEQGGRDAFALALMKRSGGESILAGNWRLDKGVRDSDMGLLLRLRDLLAQRELSRRAAYILGEVVRDMPEDQEALAAVIMYQLQRQGLGRVKDHERKQALLAEAEAMAQALSLRAVDVSRDSKLITCPGDGYYGAEAWLRDMFITAEFLAREGRTPREKEVIHA